MFEKGTERAPSKATEPIKARSSSVSSESHANDESDQPRVLVEIRIFKDGAIVHIEMEAKVSYRY